MIDERLPYLEEVFFVGRKISSGSEEKNRMGNFQLCYLIVKNVTHKKSKRSNDKHTRLFFTEGLI